MWLERVTTEQTLTLITAPDRGLRSTTISIFIDRMARIGFVIYCNFHYTRKSLVCQWPHRNMRYRCHLGSTCPYIPISHPYYLVRGELRGLGLSMRPANSYYVHYLCLRIFSFSPHPKQILSSYPYSFLPSASMQRSTQQLGGSFDEM